MYGGKFETKRVHILKLAVEAQDQELYLSERLPQPHLLSQHLAQAESLQS
jgi:hypothetical protein